MSVERAVTLQDIADRAGVSRGTASVALTGRGRLSAATRDRVLSIAKELGYEVNVGARNLRRSRTGAIGLYIPDRASSLAYYMDVAFGAVEATHGYQLSLTLIPPQRPLDMTPHVDGFIVIDASEDDPVAEAILAGRRPVVSGELVPPALPQPAASVYSDHRATMEELLDHLRQSGGKDFAVLAPPTDTAWGSDIRSACTDWADRTRTPVRLVDSEFAPSYERAASDTESVLAATSVDTIVAVPDGAALIALSAAHRAGRRVGGDLLLASYVDSPLLVQSLPPITAIDLAPRSFGRQCVNLLLRLIEPAGPEIPGNEHFAIELRRRASSRFSGDEA